MTDPQAQIERMRAKVREHNASGGNINEDAFLAAYTGSGDGPFTFGPSTFELTADRVPSTATLSYRGWVSLGADPILLDEEDDRG